MFSCENFYNQVRERGSSHSVGIGLHGERSARFYE